MLSRWSIPFFFSVFSFNAVAQTPVVSQDSLDVLLDQSYDYAYDYDYKNSLIATHALVEIATRQQDNYFATSGYLRLGSVYTAMEDTAKSKEYYFKALDYAQRTKNDSVIAGVYNDLGNMYIEALDDVDTSIEYYKKSIELRKKVDPKELRSVAAYMNIGWTYMDLVEPAKAHPYLLKAKELADGRDIHPLYFLNIDVLFGRYYYFTEDYVRAIAILEQSAKDAEEGNFLSQASESHHYLSMAYEKVGNLTASLANFKKHKEFDDQLHKINRDQKLLEASSKFQLEQTEKDLKLVTAEKAYTDVMVKKSRQMTIIFVASSAILLVALLSLFLLFADRKKFIRVLREKNRELIKAKEQAERLSKLKTQFFSTISHELRTPLYGVIGLSSILLEDKELAGHKEDLKSLKFSADYLMALINDVLTLNKSDANGMKVEKMPFRLDKLVQNVTKSCTYGLQQNNNKIQVRIDDDIPKHLLGDSVKLSQILMNLVGNAVKFNENGTIEIIIKLVERTSDGLCVVKFFIKDNGIGIPKEKQKAIFEEFSQIENSNYNYQGTGLGLPIVKKLLAIHNSEIELDSEVGAGAIFSFTLDLAVNPLQNDDLLESTYQDVPFNTLPSFDNVHILIVDDNKINQKVTQKILEKRNFSCTLADDGLEAVKIAQAKDFGLILMDVHMPNMGGMEATRAIRSFNKDVPIIALTAVEIEEIKSEILSSGMNDIILKPYDVSQFLTTILKNLGTVAAY